MKTTITTLFLMLFVSVFAQNKIANDTSDYPYWVEMMKNPNANFFETQKAFYAYWENREVTRGSGYKPFKRWENFMRTRVDEHGNRPNADQNYKAFSNLMASQSAKSQIGEWELVGPVGLPNPETYQPNGLGRLNVVAFHPTNPDIIYVGAPSGGFWKSADGGNSWTTSTDRLPTLGVSAIVVDYNNPNTIYIGTGDRDADDAPGLGVFKSTDGGQTWTRKASVMGNSTVNKMLIHPRNPKTIFAATSSGIYKTTDKANSWEKLTSSNVEFMEFKPNNPEVIYTISGSAFIYSTDGGQNWSKTSVGLQTWSRATLAVTPANPQYVYVLATNQRTFKALYQSTDGGKSFELKSTTPNIMGYSWDGSDSGGQAWYNLDIAADPVNPEVIYAGGINIFKSTDGGENWMINAHWVGSNAPAVHADQHDLAFNPLNNRLYVANDGGLYYTDNGGTSWANISSGIAISQIYKIGQSQTVRELVICGNQDNGTSLYNNGNWSTVVGGDGMESLIDHKNENYKYACLYYGALRRSVNNGNYYSIAENANGIDEEGLWVTPYALNEGDPNIMYIGMNNIWVTKNVRTVSNSSVRWKRISSGIFTSQENVAVIENSPANPDILYFARTDNKLFISRDVNNTDPSWEEITSLPNTLITDIEAHPTNENVVYVTCANRSVYKSTNQGASWISITENLPKVSINTLVYDVNTNEGIYVGTDIGVFYKDATMPEWVYFSGGLPATAEVTELEIFYDHESEENNVLRAATYGRGLWESGLFTDNTTLAYSARITGIYAPKGAYNSGDSIVPEMSIRNNGIQPINSISLLFRLNNNKSKTYVSHGTVEPGTHAVIQLPKILSNPGNHMYTIKLVAINTTEVDDYISSPFEVLKNNKIQLSLLTDSLASETEWELQTRGGELLYSSNSYQNDSMYSIKENFYLDTGCYTFILKDENGICCQQGQGSYTLTNISTQEVLGEGASFENNDTILFCVGEFPDPDFIASTTYSKVNTPITFENKTIDNNFSYSWSFGDGSTPADATTFEAPEVEYTTPGIKNIVLTATHQNNVVTNNKAGYVYIYSKPEIIKQPKPDTLCSFSKLKLETQVEGLNLNYRWYKDNQPLYSQKDRILTIENVDSSASGKYFCKISNLLFTTYTDTVDIFVKPAPPLTLTPTHAIICQGDEITLNASGTGDFYWPHSNATSSSSTVAPTKNTSFTVSLTQDGCKASKETSIVIAETPIINQQPVGQQLCEDQGANFIIKATGNGLSYTWKKNGETVFSGSNTFHIDSLDMDDAGVYTCLVTNACGELLSDKATLEVEPMPEAGFTFVKDGATVKFTSTGNNAESYSWDFGDDNYDFNANPEHTYEPGHYRPLQTVTNDCGTDTMSMQVSIFPDNVVVDHNAEQLKVYPNPANGYFSFEFNSEGYRGNIKVLLMNIEGKVLLNKELIMNSSKTMLPINVEMLPSGLYQLQLFTGEKTIRRKVLVN